MPGTEGTAQLWSFLVGCLQEKVKVYSVQTGFLRHCRKMSVWGVKYTGGVQGGKFLVGGLRRGGCWFLCLQADRVMKTWSQCVGDASTFLWEQVDGEV